MVVTAASIAAPAIFFVISAALLLFNWDIETLLSPVLPGGNPTDLLDALEHRAVQWSLKPILSGKVKAGKAADLQFDDVSPTYNATLGQIHSARENFTRFGEGLVDLRLAVMMAAVSLLPEGAYASIIAVYPQSGTWFELVTLASFAAFTGFSSVSVYAAFAMRKARRNFQNLTGAATQTLNTIQTVLIAEGKA